MLRLLIEDVTLTKGDTLHVDIRFVGGATRSLDLPLPKSCVELRTTDAEVVKEIDRLIDTYTDREIADRTQRARCAHRGDDALDRRTYRSACAQIYRLADRRTRLLASGTANSGGCRHPLRRCSLHRALVASTRSAAGTPGE